MANTSTDIQTELLMNDTPAETRATSPEWDFWQLVREWKSPLISFFYKSLGNLEDAEELASEVFVNLYQSKDSYQEHGQFRAFVFKIARNLLISHTRNKHRHQWLHTHSLSKLKAEPSASQENTRAYETHEWIERAMSQLPEKQRTALILHVQENLSHSDLADILKTSPANTKVLVHRARQQLKNEWQKNEQA